jgi:hypothetical protein
VRQPWIIGLMGWMADEIEMVSTTLLHRLFPNMKEGPTTVSCLGNCSEAALS